MARAVTTRGLRALSATVQLPREVQAASAMASKIKGMASAKDFTRMEPAAVSNVIDEAFAQTLMDMAILRDPHVSMFGRMYWNLGDAAATTPGEADFFKEQAAGVAASGVAGVWNNLLDDRNPLKPCLIHNIGIGVYIASDFGWGEELDCIMTRAMCALKRGKDSIFEFPLSQAVTNIVLYDLAGVAATIIDINPLDQGGLELEGHGAPYQMADAIGLEVSFPMGAQFQNNAAGDGLVVLTARVDGEVMEL